MNTNRTLRLLCTLLLVQVSVVTQIDASYADSEEFTNELDRPGE